MLCFKQKTGRWIISIIVIVKCEYISLVPFCSWPFSSNIFPSLGSCLTQHLLTGTLVSGASWETDYVGTVARPRRNTSSPEVHVLMLILRIFSWAWLASFTTYLHRHFVECPILFNSQYFQSNTIDELKIISHILVDSFFSNVLSIYKIDTVYITLHTINELSSFETLTFLTGFFRFCNKQKQNHIPPSLNS
jgi:hypothetical protein